MDREQQIADGLARSPYLANAFLNAKARTRFSVGRAFVQRSAELGGENRAILVAAACNPGSRSGFDKAIDRTVERQQKAFNSEFVPELVIGTGLHAAIYACAKTADDGQPPLLVDKRPRIGGTFALAQRPVFYLNSRSRVEGAGPRRPGSPGPLNSVVGAILQPSDLSFQEYQLQSDLGFITRLNIALTAPVLAPAEVVKVESRLGYLKVQLKGFKNAVLKTHRIIVASGIGEPKPTLLQRAQDDRIMTFERFLERVGDPTDPFPLKGYKRVAVVGANDSGKVTIEYLLGQGPSPGKSVSTLDYVDEIFWVGQESPTKEDFEQCNRSRYRGIGRYMPREGQPDYYYRITPVPARGASLIPEAEGIRLRVTLPDGSNQASRFDHVILCTGYENRINDLFPGLEDEEFYLDGQPVAKRFKGAEIYKVGPAAELPVTDQERSDIPALEQIPDNSVAIFRYTERTAALARHFAAIEKGG